MAKPPLDRLRLRVLYRGTGPVHWSGGQGDFGVQDKDQNLRPGDLGQDGSVTFDLSVEVKSGNAEAPVFVGPLAHGPPGDRFLYLSWRNRSGEYARRFKLPLGSITWSDVRAAWASDGPLVGELVDLQPKATSTGANIGGTRAVFWKPPAL